LPGPNIKRSRRTRTASIKHASRGEEAKLLPDVGFKVFKLDTSNVKLWDGTPTENEQLLFDRMNEMVSDIKTDRTDMVVVYEIMLKMGVPLTYKVEKIVICGKPAYSVGEDCLLLICLAENVTTEDIEAMADYAPAKIILAESSLADDTAMANAHYILKDRSIELKLV
jgi:adenine-specific DNA-methyltransferase